MSKNVNSDILYKIVLIIFVFTSCFFLVIFGVFIYVFAFNGLSGDLKNNLNKDLSNYDYNNQNQQKNLFDEDNNHKNDIKSSSNKYKYYNVSKLNFRKEEDVSFTKAERITINELFIASKILDFIKENKLNFSQSLIKIKIEDLIDIKSILNDESKKFAKLLINKDYEDLLLTQQAKKEILEEIIQARQEFLDYMKLKGVLKKYLDEFDYVLPANFNVIRYHLIDDSRLPGASVDALKINEVESDPSRQQLDMYPGGISYRMDIFRISNILGKEPVENNKKIEYFNKLRSLAIRHLLFHEFIHTMQLVYVNVNVKNPKDKGNWYVATRSPYDFDSTYYWQWNLGDVLDKLNNEIVAKESQAEGVSFLATIEILNFSDIQAEILWEHYFGRYENAKVYLNNIGNYLKTSQSSIEDFVNLVVDLVENYQGSLEDKSNLRKIVLKLNNIHAYVGYLNPMDLDRVESHFWDNFRK